MEAQRRQSRPYFVGEGTLCTVSVVRSLLFAREYAIEAFDLLEVVFEKLGTFNALSVGPGEVCFQTEVKANRMTRP